MRLLPLVMAVATASGALACVADPSPRANGYNVELWFAGPRVGQSLTVGEPAPVDVERVQSDWSACTGSSARCDPTRTTPITLVSAACDDGACSVAPVPSDDGVVHLRATGARAGAATLRVSVLTSDGVTLEDAYPLYFASRPVIDSVRAPPDLAGGEGEALPPAS